MTNDSSPTHLRCEAIEQGNETDLCGEPGEVVEIRGKIASVRACLCLYHQGVMSEEEHYLIIREPDVAVGG